MVTREPFAKAKILKVQEKPMGKLTSELLIKQLKAQKNPKNIAGMARFGIQGGVMLGIPVPILRKIAKDTGKSETDLHKLAQELWDSGIHEAKILASMVDEPEQVTSRQMDTWIKDFDSWDVCDQVCMNLFCQTDFATKKIGEWAKHEPEFERRAGFALLATWAWKRKDINDKEIAQFLSLTIKYATDERNYVKKAVNWALRQIGKRSVYLKKKALKTAQEILKLHNKTAYWIAKDAIRELEKK